MVIIISIVRLHKSPSGMLFKQIVANSHATMINHNSVFHFSPILVSVTVFYPWKFQHSGVEGRTDFTRVVKFGDFSQDVLAELGNPDRIHYKSEDKMKIHLGQNGGYVTDYFYNYFNLGVDLERFWIFEWFITYGHRWLWQPTLNWFQTDKSYLMGKLIKWKSLFCTRITLVIMISQFITDASSEFQFHTG